MINELGSVHSTLFPERSKGKTQVIHRSATLLKILRVGKDGFYTPLLDPVSRPGQWELTGGKVETDEQSTSAEVNLWKEYNDLVNQLHEKETDFTSAGRLYNKVQSLLMKHAQLELQQEIGLDLPLSIFESKCHTGYSINRLDVMGGKGLPLSIYTYPFIARYFTNMLPQLTLSTEHTRYRYVHFPESVVQQNPFAQIVKIIQNTNGECYPGLSVCNDEEAGVLKVNPHSDSYMPVSLVTAQVLERSLASS